MISAILGLNMAILNSHNAAYNMTSFGCTPLRPRDELAIANNKLAYKANTVMQDSYKNLVDRNIKSSFNIFA